MSTMALVTNRTLRNVTSRPMMPRHPEVPNLIPTFHHISTAGAIEL
jgi:hypothetical protein